MDLTAIVKNLSSEYQLSDETIDEMLYTLAHGYLTFADGQYTFAPTDSSLDGATVANGVCSCGGDPLDEDAPCLHVATVYLYERFRAQELTPHDDALPPSQVTLVMPDTQHLVHQEPHSMTVKAVNAHGFEWLICVRSATVEQLFADAKEVARRIHEHKWMSPEEYRDKKYHQDRTPSKTEDTSPPPVDTVLTPQGMSTPSATPTSGLWFDIQTLEGEKRANGNEYWKCKGGRFSKHGVTVWPEVLRAAGLTHQAPGIYPVTGYRAEYVEKEGKPDKVIRLTKVA